MQYRKASLTDVTASITLGSKLGPGLVAASSESSIAYTGLANNPRSLHFDRFNAGGCVSLSKPTHLHQARPEARAECFRLSLLFVYFKKLRFAGKGYKIKKSFFKKSSRMVFGHSHRLNILVASLWLARLAKTKFLLISNLRADLHRDSILVGLVRKLSPYTKRGRRLTRAPTIKRPGKKASY